MEGQPATEGEDDHLADGGDGLEEGLVARLEADRPHLRAVQLRRRPGQAFQFGAFLAERLHHPHPVDVLVHYLGHVALPLLAVPGSGEDPPPHAVRDEEQGRCHREADQGQQG